MIGHRLETVGLHDVGNALVAQPDIAIADLLRACEQAGSVRPNLDPRDVLLLMGAVWRTGPGEAGEKQSGRLLNLALDGLKLQPDKIMPDTGTPIEAAKGVSRS